MARPTPHTPPGDATNGRLHLVGIALVVLAFAMLAYFDLQSDLPYMDEYARQWSLNHLANDHRLLLWGQNAAIVQVLASAPLALLHTAARWWRLPQLPFLALLPLFSWKLSRRFGADRFWSSVGAAAIVCSPLTLGVATGMMNDTDYLGLLAAGCWFMLEWTSGKRGRLWFVVVASLATLQREQGLGLVIALTLGLLWTWRGDRPRLSEVGWLAAAWLSSGAALLAPRLVRTQTFGGVPVQGSGFAHLAYGVIETPIMLGLFLVPMAVALLWRSPAESEPSGRAELIPAALGILGLFAAGALALVSHAMIFPGIWIAWWGLGPPFRANFKDPFWPAPAFAAVEVVTMLAFGVALVWRRRAWNMLGDERLLLVGLAVLELVPVLLYPATYDRFYMQVAVPLVPVVVSLVSRSAAVRTEARTWALVSLALLLGIYAIGEQDYVAWHTARDQLARTAYGNFRPWQVNAGFEEEAVHVWEPATDSGGTAGPTAADACPKVALAWAPPGDPRPGVTYPSVWPQKIILVHPTC
jgi:hypothetical protein